VAQHPAGGFLSTVLDLAKWDAMLYTDKLLSESSRRQMWTPVTVSDGTAYPYGLGWELDAMSGRPQVRHGGSLAGFRSGFTRFVDDHVTIVILMNADDVDWQTIVRGVAGFYLPAPAP
jgi:CubicO group peptidase (beta-lactamase class C family)